MNLPFANQKKTVHSSSRTMCPTSHTSFSLRRKLKVRQAYHSGYAVSQILDLGKDITPQSLVHLLSLNTNIVVALSTKQTQLSSLATEFSLILPPPGTPLVSYFPERQDSASLIPVAITANPVVSKDLPPVWFSGVPQALGSNPLLVPILRAPPQSFASEIDGGSADALVEAAEKGGEGLWAGSQLSLVTGFQTLTGSRITWVGGVSLFNDELAQKEVAKYVRFFLLCRNLPLILALGASSLEMPSLLVKLLHGLSKNHKYSVSIA